MIIVFFTGDCYKTFTRKFFVPVKVLDLNRGLYYNTNKFGGIAQLVRAFA